MTIDTSKTAAAKAGVNLSDDGANFTDGYTKHPNVKRTDRRCPRCQSWRVNKVMRRCDQCTGRLLWNGDDIKPFFDKYEAFYMYMKSVFGIEGWYHSDYFLVK